MINLFFKTFGVVFLAELGDKTQLTTMTLATDGKSHWMVFAGSAFALVLSSAIAVLLGAKFGEYIPRRAIKIVAGCVFILFGILSLKDAFLSAK